MLKNKIIFDFNLQNFFIKVLLIAFVVLFLNQCRQTAQLKKVNKINQLALFDSINYYQNQLGLEVAEKQTFKGTAKDLKNYLDQVTAENEQLKEAVKKFKKLTSVIKTETITEIKEVPVPFEVKVPCVFTRTFLKEDPFYLVSGTVNETGLFFDKISFPNTQTLVVGEKKIGLFKTEFRAEVTNSNPFMKTSNIDSFTFIKKDKRFGLGVSFGLGFYKKGFFVGPSINYNFIQF